MSLLKTVSRLVAKTESTLPTVVHTPTKKEEKKEPEKQHDEEELENPFELDGFKSHPLHIVVWVHVLSVIVVAAFGWIDMFPVTGETKSLSRHLMDTENTVLCHLNVNLNATTLSLDKTNAVDLELLSNYVPGSTSFNETVQKLRRSRRGATLNHHQQHSLELHFNYTTTHRVNETTVTVTTKKKHLNHLKARGNNSTAVHHGKVGEKEKQMHRRIESSFPWKLFQGGGANGNFSLEAALNNLLRSDQTLSNRVAGSLEPTGNCGRTQIYSIVLLFVYILFAACLVSFLVISESAVFTVCVVTAALPLVGVFWSLFEISYEISDQTVVLIWSPEVSGELICSLLGAPIVFLGIFLLCRAYFNEQAVLLDNQIVDSRLRGNASQIPVSFDNCNYYATYLETGLSANGTATGEVQ